MKYYDENVYKDWEIDTVEISSLNRKFLMRGNERLEIDRDEKDGIIYIEKSNIVTPYIHSYNYYLKSQKIANSLNYFFSSALEPVGIQRNYNEMGKLIEEKNWDKPYKFSIQDLVKKFKQEYSVDLENRKNIRSVFRHTAEDLPELGIPVYIIVIGTEEEYNWKKYLIDGNTGKTLYEQQHSYGDKNDIIEKYLESTIK